MIWVFLGGALICAIHFPAHVAILAVWTGDLLGLFYIIGVMLTNNRGRVSGSLVKIAATLIGLIGTSAFLWFHAGTDGARAFAVTVAGGPPLFVAVGYGFVLGVSLLSGRKHS